VAPELARTAYTDGRRPVAVSHQILRGDGAVYRYQVR
jgi:hypothetical protein